MVIGVCTVDLLIPESHNLKEKRHVLRSMLEGLRSKFNVSAAEVDHLDLWQRAVIGIACVSNEQKFVDQVLNKITDWIEANPRISVVSIEVEFL